MRDLAWIVLGILLACFPLRAQQQSQPSEETTPPEQKSSAVSSDLNQLKEDKLGESLDVFKTNHPKVRCIRRDSALSDCHVWEDVSIGGVPVRGIENCRAQAEASAATTTTCFQGIDAHFVTELLAGLSYIVEGDDGAKDRIVSALNHIYGPSTSDDKSQTIWSNDLLILSVTLLKTDSKTSYIAVTLDLKPSEAGEDI